MRGRAALLLIALSPCGCAPRSDAPPPAALGLNCALPFETQAAKLAAQPHLAPAPHEAGEPYRFYSTQDGQVSYVITEPGAPGHPAILMQTAAGGTVTTTGCPYGDPKGYAQVVAYVESLKAPTHR